MTNKEEEEKLDIAKQYTNLSLRDLAERFPNWDWDRFFRTIFRNIPYQVCRDSRNAHFPTIVVSY